MEHGSVITAKEIARLVYLKETPSMQKETAELLDFARAMNVPQDDCFEEETPMELREDVPGTSMDREALLNQAPERKDSYIRLPNTLGAVT